MASAGDLGARVERAKALVDVRRHQKAPRPVQRYASRLASLRHEQLVRSVLLALAVLVPAALLFSAGAEYSPIRLAVALMTEIVLLGAALAGSGRLESWVARVEIVMSRTMAVITVTCLLVIVILVLIAVVAAASNSWTSVIGTAAVVVGFILVSHGFLEPVVVVHRQASAYLPVATATVAWAGSFAVVVVAAVALVQSGLVGADLATAIGVAAASVLGAAMVADLRRQRRLLTELVVALDELVAQLSEPGAARPSVRSAWLRVERALTTTFLGRTPLRLLSLGDSTVVAALRQYRSVLLDVRHEPIETKGRVGEIAAELGVDVAQLPRAVVQDEVSAFLMGVRTRLARWVDVVA